MKRLLPQLLAMIALLAAPRFCFTQETTTQETTGAPSNPPAEEAQKETKAPPAPTAGKAPDATQGSSNSTLENTIEAGEEDTPKLVSWHEYKGRYITARFGAGLLLEANWFSQDEESKQQIALEPGYKLRDFRFILGGRFPKFERSVTWCAGIMYDAPTNSWLIRQTGVMIAVPELWGNFFIGRAKTGFSLNKVMVGYDGWTMERFTMSDASITLLADGIKWLGYSPKHGFLWNLGYFNDVFSKGQSFSSYSHQEVARLVWLPLHSEADGTLFHLGVNLQWGKPADGQLRLKSRPEAFTAPFFLDTGKFAASRTFMTGYEVYYRRRSWLIGSEYYFQNVSSESKGNPQFHGGDVVTTWLITGETRKYNTVGGYFTAISPKRPVFSGGPGAWELVLRYSQTDLNSGKVQGGKFQRITPMVNWYLNENVRLEMAYGYGHLDRFDLKGNTQFFQSRIQLQF